MGAGPERTISLGDYLPMKLCKSFGAPLFSITRLGFCFLFVAALLTVLGIAAKSTADDLIWSGNNSSDGNAGTWDTTNAHWSTTSGGPYTTIWSNSPVNNAILQGTPGTMTTGAAVTVNLITINTALAATTNSWLLGNSTTLTTNKITFSGTNSGINANYTSGTTWLRNAAQGTLTKTGPGRVELDNTSMGITKYFINGGALTVPNVSRLGTAPGSLVSDFFTFDGGGFGINTATVTSDLGATRGVTVMAGGAFFSTSASTVIPTISAPIVGTSGGNVTVGGTAAVWTGTAHTSGGVWTLTNTGNSWDGNLVLNGASGTKVLLGASGVIPDTAVVTLSASGNVFDLNGFNETVKSVSGTAGTVAVGVKTLTLDNPNGESYTSVFTGTAGGQVIKNGAGLLTLSGGSSGFSGEFVVNNGTIGVGGTGVFGSNAAGPQLTMNGGTLSNNSATGRSMSSNLSVNLNGNFTVDDSQFATQGQILFNGTATIKNSNRTITVNGTANLGFAGAVGQDVSGRSLTKAGTGILALTAVNTYSGSTTIQAGQININSTGTLGDGTGDLNLNGGTLNETASRSGSGQIVANPINLNASSSITSSASAATPIFEFSGPLTGTAGQTLTFHDDAATATQFKPRFSGTFTFDGDINLQTGTGALTASTQLESFNTTGTTQTFTGKITGPGTYNRSASSAGSGGDTVFTHDNDYAGGTTINRGRLYANNTSGSATGSGGVTVGGNGTLAGNGSVDGLVTVSGFGIVAPGNPGVNNGIDTLGLKGGLTLSDGAVLNIDVGAPGTSDLINSSLAAVTFPSATPTTPAILNINDTGGLGVGTYTIIDYGTLSGSLSNTAVTINGPGSFTYSLFDNSGSSTIELHVMGAGQAGDYNGDGKVDAADYVAWRLGNSPNPNSQGDYDTWRANFGAGAGSGSGGGGLGGGGPVPEPGTLALVGLVSAGLLMLRRRMS